MGASLATEQGQQITGGKYEVVRRLATGGMAEIYLVRARGLGGFEKLLVLKRILPQFADSQAMVDMFLDEARLAARLHHPNIAAAYEFDRWRGSYFYTMEYLQGLDLATVLQSCRERGLRIPLSVALTVVHGVAQRPQLRPRSGR